MDLFHQPVDVIKITTGVRGVWSSVVQGLWTPISLGVFGLMWLWCFVVDASIPPKRALDHKKNMYIQEGVLVGGRTGDGFSLVDIRRLSSKKDKAGLERLVIQLGDRKGNPLKGPMGYYHVAVEKDPHRIVIDLTQVGVSRLTEAQILARLRELKSFKDAFVVQDSEAGSLKIVLSLKRPVAIEVFEPKSKEKPPRLVIDLYSRG